MEALLLTLDVFFVLLLAISVTKVESSSKEADRSLGLFAFREHRKNSDQDKRKR